MKQNLIRTIDLIGKSLHPNHIKRTDFIFQGRSDLISHLLVSAYMHKKWVAKPQNIAMQIFGSFFCLVTAHKHMEIYT